MNEEDKKRFARYKKGYIDNENENDYINTNTNNTMKTKLGVVNKVDVNMNVLIGDIISSTSKSKN
jgi:hypothetical protein